MTELHEIPAVVEAFLDRHERPLNPFYPADEDAAIVSRAMAKVKTLALAKGMTCEAFADAMELMDRKARAETMREVNSVRVDPRTGGGLS